MATSTSRRDDPGGRWNFTALVWHGVFFAAGSALAEPSTALPAYVTLLSGSPVVVGLVTSVLLAGDVLPQLLFSRWVEVRARKKGFLVVAVYSRALAWLLLGALTLLWAGRGHGLLLAVLLVLVATFALGGSLGAVAFVDMVGKSVRAGARGRFYASRQFLGGVAALAAGFLARAILARPELAFPRNYALLFVGAGVALGVAGAGFLALREPAAQATAHVPVRAYLAGLRERWRRDAALRSLVVVENLAGLHLMLLPFYVTLAQRRLGAGPEVVGTFIVLEVVGGAVSNLLWGWLADRRGSPSVLRACLLMGAAVPLVALALAQWAPGRYGLVFLLVGAAVNSRNLSFGNVLVDIAPAEARPTYSGLVGTLTAPRLAFPLLGGALIGWLGYRPVFLAVAAALLVTLVGLGGAAPLYASARRELGGRR
ncbi:MAG TPA: MFS transporter [Trueperaceae bacterium]|nr:MFS transporter [Trueperaceae bacterium]